MPKLIDILITAQQYLLSFIKVTIFSLLIQESSLYIREVQMNQNESSGKVRLTNTLHITMITLSVIACIYMYFIPSFTTKLIICIIIIAYSFTIISRSSSIRNLLKITLTKEEQNYSVIRKWDLQKEKVGEMSNKKQKSIFDNSSILIQRRNKGEADLNNSLEKSLERSMDIKNISMSLQRSMNLNNLNETRLSRLSQRGTKEFKGADISQIFAADESYNSDSLLRKTKRSGITLVDNQTYLSHNTSKYLQQANNQYDKMLKNVVKKQKKCIEKKYKPMVQMMKSAVKVLVSDHNTLRDKFIKIAQECFDVKIVENKSSLREQMNFVSLRHTQTKRISFYLFLYQMLLVYTNKIQVSALDIKFKNGHRWLNVYFKIAELAQVLFKLSQILGVDSQPIKSQLKTNAQAFVEEYRGYIELAQFYLENQTLQNHSTQMEETTYQSQLQKSRFFALYLIVKEINLSLKYAGKVKFNDYFGFRYPKDEKFQFQINKREGTEGPYVHYDLKVFYEGQQKAKYYCEPGDKNYLSVLYFLFFQFSQKEELLSWNTYMKGMVKQFV